MRGLILGLLGALFLVAPAMAQTVCKITNNADGKASAVSGEITGVALSKLITASGPIAGKLTMAPGASYKALKGKAPEMTIYRAGDSVPDKDWRQPGSVQTEEGGVSVAWPGFTLNGARVQNVTAEFSKGYTKIRGTANHPKGFKGADAFLLPVHWNVRNVKAGVMLDLNYDMMNQWRSAFGQTLPLAVDIFDETAGVLIAKIEFPYPASDIIQSRLVSDVNALRKAFADGACK